MVCNSLDDILRLFYYKASDSNEKDEFSHNGLRNRTYVAWNDCWLPQGDGFYNYRVTNNYVSRMFLCR